VNTRAEFRLLVLFNALLIPAAMFISTYDAFLLPPQLQSWLMSRSTVLVSGVQSIGGTISFVGFVAICIGLLGMLAFQRWARALTLWGTILIYLPMPLSGTTVLSGFAYTFDSVAALIWGSVLAAAYWAPVSAEFAARPRLSDASGRAARVVRPQAPAGPVSPEIPVTSVTSATPVTSVATSDDVPADRAERPGLPEQRGESSRPAQELPEPLGLSSPVAPDR